MEAKQNNANNFVDQIKDLPGTDMLRSIILIVLATGFLIGIRESPTNIPSLFRDLSIYISVIVIFCTGVSMVQSVKLPTFNDIENLSTPKLFFYPKITVSIAVLLFFISLCIWVVLLGGVIKSPFGSVLLLSPIFFVLEFIRKEDIKKYHNFMNYCLSRQESQAKKKIEIERFQKYVRLVRILQFLPLLFILITIIFGELSVYFGKIHLFLLNCDIKAYNVLIQTNWFTAMSYSLYYSSIIAMTISIIPRDSRRDLWDKLIKAIYS